MVKLVDYTTTTTTQAHTDRHALIQTKHTLTHTCTHTYIHTHTLYNSMDSWECRLGPGVVSSSTGALLVPVRGVKNPIQK